tara:strand:+ start:13570 stop:13884 length:315 start_codon:yes stop_codon:yes gene_type:complete
MSGFSTYFKRKHVRVLAWLILLDLVATLSWFFFFGIEEANPILAPLIESSPVKFAAFKLGLSFPGIYFLNKYISKGVVQGGLAVLLFTYYIVALIHAGIFIMVC